MSKIGSYLEGGFYMGDLLGKKLILSPNKYETRLRFGGYGRESSAYSRNNGKGNTLDLVLRGDHPAAEYCYNLDINGYTDWYLPAIEEFHILCENNEYLPKEESFDKYYWSSTEYSSDGAWFWYFISLFEDVDHKNGSYYVRPIRRIPV